MTPLYVIEDLNNKDRPKWAIALTQSGEFWGVIKQQEPFIGEASLAATSQTLPGAFAELGKLLI